MGMSIEKTTFEWIKNQGWFHGLGGGRGRPGRGGLQSNIIRVSHFFNSSGLAELYNRLSAIERISILEMKIWRPQNLNKKQQRNKCMCQENDLSEDHQNN